MADSYASGDAAQYSMQLLRGQMLNQLMLGQIGGLSLNEFILGKESPRRSGRDMMHDALTGLMRSDAAMLRQASKNMGEGEAISKLAGESVKSIGEKIARMREIAAEASGSPANLPELKAEYGDLASQIKATIENTFYNGMQILDGGSWGDEERVSESADGATGKLVLQAGRSPTDLTLYNLETFKDFKPADLDPGILTATAVTLSEAQKTLGGMQESYEARAGLYASEASSYARQAGILDEASGISGGDVQSLKDALLNILLREQGLVVNYNS
ncbi:MAG: hypothetical protein LBM00_05120 [Deltaproteobacteria bacterium]|jgi:flagellin|nr:hypothetical protein [Deltaproteobacteria bacterium]